MKRILCALMALALVLLPSCAKEAAGEATQLSFLQAVELSEIQKLDGKQVTILGYMATLSPISGGYIYLMNLPYQSCPFCIPNTTQLSNTMAVYAKKGEKFDYTEQAIRVTGTMELGDYTDDYGYVYNYRIVGARCEAVDLSTVSEEYALWQSIAGDGVVGELAKMFDYLSFVCMWPEYTMTQTNEDGSQTTFNLYPGDAENILKDDGAYGYAAFGADDYFGKLTARVNAISQTELSDLAAIISDAQALEEYALAELAAGNYAYDEAADKYQLTNAQKLSDDFDALYKRYAQWLGKWEI